jgi:ribonuclease D
MEVDELSPAWIDTPAGVNKVAAACRSAERFALDTEADSLHSYFHKVCLIQVSAADQHFLIDPLALDHQDLEPLWRVVADPGLPVIMHGADYDIRVLDRDFEARIGGLLDTQVMAQILGEQKTGLGVLLELEIGITLNKKFQRANWGQRPLPDALLKYATADTAFLGELCGRFRHRLEALDRWQWVIEDSARLESVRHVPPVPDPLAFERIKGARTLRGPARNRCFSLHGWREQVAQEQDVPPFKILGNQALLQLAQKPPADRKQLAMRSGVSSRLVRQWGKQVLSCLQRPSPAPERSRHRSPVQSVSPHSTKRLLEVRDKIAAELELDPGLICPKALVQDVAAKGLPTTTAELEARGLTGWRLELLGDSFIIQLKQMT